MIVCTIESDFFMIFLQTPTLKSHTMANKEELETMYRALLGAGVVKNKKDLATQLGLKHRSVLNAFSVGAPYLNDSLLNRIRTQFPDVINNYDTNAEPDTATLPSSTLQSLQETISSQQRTIESQQRTIEALLRGQHLTIPGYIGETQKKSSRD